MLQAAWIYAQEECERTGTILELRFTTLGLTVFNADALCTRNATVSWAELARSEDIARLFAKVIRRVAEQPSLTSALFAEKEKLAA
ncbi:hypothetical protein MOX02_28740 [Methylobacterium oxalidis]|uniref:Uncharacterized protein n=1 Tax=Methylobacterium oxalidis TaxID=944322 RepID=A0A512J4E5_9HYPH|nr:hypothetical protein MOX02_28740 [Methylobacterium oxalidis]